MTAANVFSTRPNYPIHFDRLFSAGGNSRSALETLLIHTPHFFICYPQRINPYTSETDDSLKHIMWCPDQSHAWGEKTETIYDGVITELELGSDVGDIRITQEMLGSEFDSIEAKRIHTQMQVALVEIGRALKLRSWIARNDRKIPVGNVQLGQMEGVIESLQEITLLHTPDIKEAASLIDCVWFTADGQDIPAVFEVENSTDVINGLNRMRNLKAKMRFLNKFVIVAPNERRNEVIRKVQQPSFRDLKARFMPYSAVRELYGIIQRYALADVRSVDYTFADPFMETIVED